jgi:competence protein ComEA
VGRHARVRLPLHSRVGGWLGDRVPAGLRGRTHLGSAQVGLVSLVVAAGLLVGVWWFLGAGGADAGVAVPARSSPDAPATAATPATPEATGAAVAPAPEAEGEIVVDVVGKVERPGIVVLPAGARVSDAVREAGGLRGRVDRTTLNLARPLTDGEQVVVGLPGPASGLPPSSSPASGGDLVNLNTADQTALETLPGVGPVTAAAILEWRQANGAFTAVEELLEVSGIGEATLAEIAPHVTL